MRRKVEVPKEEFDKFVKANPTLIKEGFAYVENVQGSSHIWRKAMAFELGNKFYLIKDN